MIGIDRNKSVDGIIDSGELVKRMSGKKPFDVTPWGVALAWFGLIALLLTVAGICRGCV